ncbi:copper resistance protein B [Asticcacaulis sp. SL142]|uniref:copper resistance protein B n=1 Tax=Asticcacaulis sp. SL142 TaxID=2995155 RepID=UPI00226CAA81|nr:copper resistance protein B [Asticcacaulis sp. SL142]WAC48540.1 copper resistance protein B [Asticcacaulis sp. SL142]
MNSQWLIICGILAASDAAAETDHKHHHGGMIFHTVVAEVAACDDRQHVDIDGRVGGDTHKFTYKIEGERHESEWETAEVWALYSRNVSTFWDAQVGIRQDMEPKSHAYLTAGASGLAPYFFETEAHLFVRDDGKVSARLRQENDLLLTQKWIVQPFIEIEAHAQDDLKTHIGAGFSSAEIGLQTRYEITRRFAPFIEVKHETKLGETAAIARRLGEDQSETVIMAGVRAMF